MKKLIAPIALLAALATSSLATAQAMQEVSTTVDYSDLNLASAKDAARLNDRLEFAIARVCVEPMDASIEDDRQQRACKADARRRVHEELAARALHDKASGRLALQTGR